MQLELAREFNNKKKKKQKKRDNCIKNGTNVAGIRHQTVSGASMSCESMAKNDT